MWVVAGNKSSTTVKLLYTLYSSVLDMTELITGFNQIIKMLLYVWLDFHLILENIPFFTIIDVMRLIFSVENREGDGFDNKNLKVRQ